MLTRQLRLTIKTIKGAKKRTTKEIKGVEPFTLTKGDNDSV